MKPIPPPPSPNIAPQAKRQSKTSTVVFMSALVYPGLGQFIQRRWLFGSVYLLLFTGCGIAFAMAAFRSIYNYYHFIDDPNTVVTTISIVPILVTFAGAMLCWLFNVIDVLLAQRRRQRQRHNLDPMTFTDDD